MCITHMCCCAQWPSVLYMLLRDGASPVQDKFQTTLQRWNRRDDLIGKQKHTNFPLPSRFLQTSLIITGNPHFSSLSLPLWKMWVNRPLFRMVMNDTQNLVTALLKSITGPCLLTRNEYATAYIVQATCKVSVLCSFTALGTATVCQPYGLFYFNKI